MVVLFHITIDDAIPVTMNIAHFLLTLRFFEGNTYDGTKNRYCNNSYYPLPVLFNEIYHNASLL